MRVWSGSVDRDIDAIKNTSKPSSKLQFCLKIQETTSPIFQNACGMIKYSTEYRMVAREPRKQRYGSDSRSIVL